MTGQRDESKEVSKLAAEDAEQPRGGTQDLEAIVEAMARGETVEGMSDEEDSGGDSELDTRRSKSKPVYEWIEAS